MAAYALMDGGTVVEVLQLAEDAEPAKLFHPDLVAALRPLSEAEAATVKERWTFTGTAFEPPTEPEAPAPRKTITPREFRERWTLEERKTVTLAASAALAAGDASLQVFLDDLASATAVELDHPDLQAGMRAVVEAGILSQERADMILSAEPVPGS